MENDYDNDVDVIEPEKNCEHCNGSGWVEVDPSNDEEAGHMQTVVCVCVTNKLIEAY